MNLKKSIRRILREETEGYKVNLVKKIIYTLYDNISFIEESTYDGKPLLIIYFESDDNAANIESWFDEKISRDIREWTSDSIVVCPDWAANWDWRKKNADVFINTELIKHDELGNAVNESMLREETEISSNVKRRFNRLKELLYIVLDESNPCDYSDIQDYFKSVLYDLETTLLVFKMEGMTSEEILSVVENYFYEDIRRYYINSLEDC